jgi:hypothetical protein
MVKSSHLSRFNRCITSPDHNVLYLYLFINNSSISLLCSCSRSPASPLVNSGTGQDSFIALYIRFTCDTYLVRGKTR